MVMACTDRAYRTCDSLLSRPLGLHEVLAGMEQKIVIREGDSPYVDSLHGLVSQAWVKADALNWQTEMAVISSGTALLIAAIALFVAIRKDLRARND